MKYATVEHMRPQYPVAALCRLLGVSVSGYYAWRGCHPSMRQQAESRLEADMQAAHRRTRETFGPERRQKELAGRGVEVGVHRIKRIRRKLGLRCRQKRKFKATLIQHTDRGSQYCAHDYQALLKQFKMQASLSRKEIATTMPRLNHSGAH